MTEAPEVRVICDDGRQSAAAAAIARGTRRMLLTMGMSTITELTLASGRRADIVALTEKGEIWIVEIKSSVADFRADAKWPDYYEYADRLLFAVAPDFPVEILPKEAGLILADAYGGDLARPAPLRSLPPARRKALTQRYARVAALRLHALSDPEFVQDRLE
jgi:hypothetical protein